MDHTNRRQTTRKKGLANNLCADISSFGPAATVNFPSRTRLKGATTSVSELSPSCEFLHRCLYPTDACPPFRFTKLLLHLTFSTPALRSPWLVRQSMGHFYTPPIPQCLYFLSAYIVACNGNYRLPAEKRRATNGWNFPIFLPLAHFPATNSPPAITPGPRRIPLSN